MLVDYLTQQAIAQEASRERVLETADSCQTQIMAAAEVKADAIRQRLRNKHLSEEEQAQLEKQRDSVFAQAELECAQLHRLSETVPSDDDDAESSFDDEDSEQSWISDEEGDWYKDGAWSGGSETSDTEEDDRFPDRVEEWFPDGDADDEEEPGNADSEEEIFRLDLQHDTP